MEDHCNTEYLIRNLPTIEKKRTNLMVTTLISQIRIRWYLKNDDDISFTKIFR